MGLKKRPPNPMHLATSGERYTPHWIAEDAHFILGHIDLDPASSMKANSIIGANTIYTARSNGLRKPWAGTVFLNAPGSCPYRRGRYSVCGSPKRCSCGLVGQFWDRFCMFVLQGAVPYGLWLGFQLGQLQTLQGRVEESPLANPPPVPTPLEMGPTCIFRDRIRYLDENLNELKQPSHGGYLTLVKGDGLSADFAEDRFRRRLAHKGVIVEV